MLHVVLAEAIKVGSVHTHICLHEIKVMTAEEKKNWTSLGNLSESAGCMLYVETCLESSVELTFSYKWLTKTSVLLSC